MYLITRLYFDFWCWIVYQQKQILHSPQDETNHVRISFFTVLVPIHQLSLNGASLQKYNRYVNTWSIKPLRCGSETVSLSCTGWHHK